MSKPQNMLYQNSQHSRVMNVKYKSKYKKMKHLVKNFIFENAAICDEVAKVQAELTVAREERRFLIKRLMRHEGIENVERQEQQKEQQQQPQEQQVEQEHQQQQQDLKVITPPKKRGPKKRTSATALAKPMKNKTRDKITLDSDGKPIFPINLYNILIHSPGEIVPTNPNFHANHWVYPVGYVATRIYAHPKDPQRKCVYTCKILNNAGMPQFQIIPDNDLDSVFFGESANICHEALLRTLQHSLSDVVKLPHLVQGEKFFGLANPTVISLMQMDPSLTQCQNFEGFFIPENEFTVSEDKDPTLCYEALQMLIAMSSYHTMPEIRDAPPDELLNFN